jgi:hypothetical protein
MMLSKESYREESQKIRKFFSERKGTSKDYSLTNNEPINNRLKVHLTNMVRKGQLHVLTRVSVDYSKSPVIIYSSEPATRLTNQLSRAMFSLASNTQKIGSYETD